MADAGYCNELVIEYLKNNEIEGFIPNATQSRENIRCTKNRSS